VHITLRSRVYIIKDDTLTAVCTQLTRYQTIRTLFVAIILQTNISAPDTSHKQW